MPPTFGERRLKRGRAERALFRVFGVVDPSHYLHHRYVGRTIARLPLKPKRILDAGCGTGDHALWLARTFPDAEVLGIDVDGERVEQITHAARDLGIGNVRFRTLDLCALDEGDFDLVISVDVLEHIPDQRRALGCIADSLVSGGFAYLHIPTIRERPVLLSGRLTEFHEWAEKEHVADDLTAEEFAERVTEAGLDVLDVRRTFGRWSGELACSLFALPYNNTPLNRVAQIALALPCRALAVADELPSGTRYAAGVLARKR